jgi:chemotaxis signal transduction protein
MECAQVRSDTLSALLGWSGGEGQESLTEEEARAAEPSDESKRELFFRDAERTIGLMSEAIGVLRHHPAESLTTASRLCHTLAERFDGMGYVFGAVFIRDIEGTLEGLLRRLPQGMVPGMDKAMADLTIQIDEVALSLVSYLDELQQRGEDLAECAESRIYLVEALVAWNPTVAPPPAEPANPADLLLGAVFGRDDSTAPPLEPPPAPVVPPAPSAAAVVEPWPVPRAEEAEAPRYSAVDSEPEWEVWTGSWQDEEPEPAVSPGGSREPGAVEYLIFECRGQEYALPVGALAEVVRGERVLPLPYDRPEVAGVVNYQGEAVPVLRLDGEPHAEGAIARYLLIVGRDESRCGIEAERISRIASLAPRDFRPCAGARWTPFTCQTLRVVDL